MEYFYYSDKITKVGEWMFIPIRKKSVMIDVIKLEDGTYECTSKKTGVRFSVPHAWMLVENTHDNFKLIKRIGEYNGKVKQLEAKINLMKSKIKTI